MRERERPIDQLACRLTLLAIIHFFDLFLFTSFLVSLSLQKTMCHGLFDDNCKELKTEKEQKKLK